MTPLTKALKGIYKQIRRYNDTEKEGKKIPPHERHGTTSDKISVAVNAILAALTLLAIYFAYQSNKTSQYALEYAKHKDSLDNIEQVKKDVIEESERLFNRQYVDSTLSISNKSVNAASRSSQIAEQALIETKKSYEFSREAAIKEIRAYTVGNGFSISNIIEDSLIKIEANLTNVGKTPAYKMRTIAGCIFGTSENAPNIIKFTKQASQSIDTATISTLGAGQNTSLPLTHNVVLTKDILQLIKNNTIQIYVIINIVYYDIFGVFHFTHSFSKYNYYNKQFLICKTYNDAN